MPENDPRVFFAAERTLLAWVRTGLGLVGMGFVVAKFGLFLRLLHPNADHGDHPWMLPLGVALALLGALASGVASCQHRRFCRTRGRTNCRATTASNLAWYSGSASRSPGSSSPPCW